MKHTLSIILLVVLSGALAACNSEGTTAPKNIAPDSLEPPSKYASKINLLTGDAAAAAAGQATFAANCASCHGESGKGDGPAGGALNPSPGILAERQMSLSDAYLFWRISEGGMMEPFQSAMPAWNNLLDEDQIWQVITYIRTLNN